LNETLLQFENPVANVLKDERERKVEPERIDVASSSKSPSTTDGGAVMLSLGAEA
jgi:hypothetical protein